MVTCQKCKLKVCTLHSDGRRPTAIGHLSDSIDVIKTKYTPKSNNINYNLPAWESPLKSAGCWVKALPNVLMGTLGVKSTPEAKNFWVR